MDPTAANPHPPPGHRVVIVGGGFAGLNAAKALKGAPVDVTLIDRQNHHLFQPLLYQVATAALNPADIAHPIRSTLRRQKNARVMLAEVTAVDLKNREVRCTTATGETRKVPYDSLILAAGATHSYFGNEGWRDHAPGLKSIEDAREIRRRVLLAYEQAEMSSDPKVRRALLTFAVVGAGPTGVELAGALAEIGRHAVSGDFRTVEPSDVRVVLVEGTDRVLPPYPESLSKKAQAQLEDLGVEVQLGHNAEAIDGDGITVNGEQIPCRTVLWAAGVQASPLGDTLQSPDGAVQRDRAGRVKVAADLTIPGHPEVFVVGDQAHHETDGTMSPGIAPNAIQGGQHAAKAIRRRLRGQPVPAYRYRDKGDLATIGRAKAVADIPFPWPGAKRRVRFGGYPAWLLWLVIHVAFLVGFRNRILVILQWGWNYLTFRRGARLISGGIPAETAAKPDEAPQSAGV